mgnify:CR=1 FL=1
MSNIAKGVKKTLGLLTIKLAAVSRSTIPTLIFYLPHHNTTKYIKSKTRIIIPATIWFIKNKTRARAKVKSAPPMIIV